MNGFTGFRIELVGPMRVHTPDGQPFVLTRPKASALLAVLALAHPEPVGREKLCRLLWPDLDDTLARASLRRAAKNLVVEVLGNGVLEASRHELRLQPDRVWVDVSKIREATPDKPCSLDLLNDGLLVGMTGLGRAFERHIQIQREMLEDRAQRVAHAALLLTSSPGGVVRAARRLLFISPTHEGATQALMQAHQERGERTLAIAVLERCRRALRTLFGVNPSPATERLATQHGMNTAPTEHNAEFSEGPGPKLSPPTLRKCAPAAPRPLP